MTDRPDTLDQLTGNLIELEAADHAVRWSQGDQIVEWLGTHTVRRGEGRAFWGALASSLGHSASFVHDLYRVAKTFPDHRDPERDWCWFRECAREDDPIAAMKRFDGLSVREIRDLRRSERPHEGKPQRVTLTLLPAHLEALRRGQAVLSAVIPPDTRVRVSISPE